MREILPSDLVLWINNIPVIVLPPDLVAKQELDIVKLEKLKAFYLIKLSIFDEMFMEEDRNKLRVLDYILQQLEFRVQREWGFSEDIKYHYWWLESPKCTCPKFDNLDQIPSPNRVINCSCIIHGE